MMTWLRLDRFTFLPYLAIATLLAAGCGDSKSPPDSPPGVDLRILHFDVEPGELDAPGEVTASWHTQGADSIQLRIGGEPVALEDGQLEEGSISVHVDVTTSFVLEVRAGDEVLEETRTVEVASPAPEPRIGSFHVPAQVEADPEGVGTVSLSWSGIEHADELLLEATNLEPTVLDPSASSGSAEVDIEADTTFTLIARNEEGEARLSAETQLIRLPVIVFFEGNRTALGAGEELLLSWETEDAVDIALFLNGEPVEGWDREQAAGEFALPIWLDSRLELVASNEFETSVDAAWEVEVVGPELVSFSASADSFWLGEAVELSWEILGGSELTLVELNTGETLLHTTSLEEIAATTWEWSPSEPGSYLIELTVSNTSGVVTQEVGFSVGTGPIVASFVADPTELSVGDEFELSWEVLPDPAGNQPIVRIEDEGRDETVAPVGSAVFTAENSGTRTITLIATSDDPRSTAVEQQIDVIVHPLADLHLTATPTLFDDSVVDEVEISWTTTDAREARIDWEVDGAATTLLEIGSDLAAGSYAFSPREAGTLILVGANSLGKISTAEVAIDVAPTEVLALVATPSTITHGQAVTLNWKTRMADEVRLELPGGAYLREEITGTYRDVEALGAEHLPLDDDCNGPVATHGCAQLRLPFIFPFNGQNAGTIRVYTTGVISFDSSSPYGSISANTSFPTEPVLSWIHLAPFWDALAWDTDRYPEGNIHHLHQIDETEESFIIQWGDVGFAGTGRATASVSFQVVLWKDGRFEYRYGPTNPRDTDVTASMLAGAGATIGYQFGDQSAFDMIADRNTIPMLGSPELRAFSYRERPTVGKNGELVFHPYPSQTTLNITMEATRGETTHSLTETVQIDRKPVLTLNPFDPRPAETGVPFRLGWNTFYADRVEVIDDRDQLRCEATSPSAISESFCELTESEVGIYDYRVRASGANGSATVQHYRTSVYAPFGIVSFEADQLEVEQGQSVTLSWETFNGKQLRLLAGGVVLHSETDPAGEGSFTFASIQENTEFVLEVINPIGLVETSSIAVELWDVAIDVQTSNTTIRPGQPIDVSIDATILDGGGAATVFGNLPLVEVFEGHGYSDISTHPDSFEHPILMGPAGSDSTVDIELPTGFTFPYMGETYTSARVFIDGYLSFSPQPFSTKDNQRLPFDGTPEGRDVHLAPFWDDLHAWSTGKIHSAALDADTFVIQWSRMSMDLLSFATNPFDLNFQIVLHRSGAFEFRYGTMNPPAPPYQGNLCYPSSCENEAKGSNATIGFQWNEGRSGHTLHFGGAGRSPNNSPFPGGLTNRSFRYEPVIGQRSFQVTTDVDQTLEFCSLSAGEPVCKEVEVTTLPFGLDSFTISESVVASGQPVTLSWTSHGGVQLNIWRDDTLVHSTTDYAEIDAGSTTDSPPGNAVYLLELIAGSFRQTSMVLVDVAAMSLGAQVSQSTHPGAPITLSWTLDLMDSSISPVLAVPMEDTTGSVSFDELMISWDDDALIIGGSTTNQAVDVDIPGFSFPFFGKSYSTIRVATDGYITFEGTGNSNGSNQVIPNTSDTYRHMNLAPFWDDLHTRANGKVYAKQVDPDTFVVHWAQMSMASGTSNNNEGDLNFMVVLRSDGRFEYRFGRMAPPPAPANTTSQCNPVSCENETNGSAATIGYQDPSGRAGYMVHFGGLRPGPANKPMYGGLSHRSWRFTPQNTSGSAQINPIDTSTYKICALEPASGDVFCAPTIEAEVPWGVDLFEPSPSAPVAGATVSMGWKVMGLDSMQITANGATIASYSDAASIPAMGSVDHILNEPTTFVLEGESLGREVRAERVVVPRSFNLSVTAPSDPVLLGEKPTVSWEATNVTPGQIAVLSPMSEVDAGAGSTHAFLDVSGLEGAVEVEMSGTNGFGTIDLPFTFPYLGSEQQSLQVYVDGYLSFAGAGGNSNGSHRILPEPTNRIHLAPYWKNTEMLPTGPERIWAYSPDPNTQIIQWKNFNATRGSSISARYNLNFQVVLHSNGSFEYRYGEMLPPPPPHSDSNCAPASCIDDANGRNAVIGYQSADGLLGSNLHIGTLEPPPSGFGQVSLTPPAGQAFPGGLSHRSFVYSPGATGSSKVVVGRSGSHQVCAMLDGYSQCETVRLEARADLGDLAITELMIDPASPEGGQWLEIRNTSHRAIDLEGFTLRSQQGSHEIGSSISLAPGGFATLATSANVGFVPDYIIGTPFTMGRLSDRLELFAGEMAVASVAWGIDWEIPTGESLSLDPLHHATGIVDHSEFEKWCSAGVAGNPGALGSPCDSEAFTAGYTVDLRSSRPFIDIASTGTRLHDVEASDSVARLPNTGFLPYFFGQTYGRTWVATNGWISFYHDEPASPNAATPSNLPRSPSANPRGPIFAAFWEKLACDRSAFDCRFYYELREVDGQDVLILQWDGFEKGPGGSITFQMQLWESGDLVVAFPALDNPFAIGTNDWFNFEGGTGWIGAEPADTSQVVTVHHKRILGLSQRSIHFQPR